MSLTKTEFLLTLKHEISKEYLEVDPSGRVSKIYAAPSAAVSGDRCLVKEFIYHGSTVRVKGRAEGYGVWSSSFDGGLDDLVDEFGDFLTDDMGNQLTG